MKRIVILLSVLVLVFGVSASAEAAVQYPSTNLWDMGDGTIYDTDTQLSWLKDANMAGMTMNWVDANAWAASLNTLNAGSGYANLTGWRLPITTQPDPNCSTQSDPDGPGPSPAHSIDFNCINSEMGHLYYIELGNPARAFTNPGPFVNLQSGIYWAGSEVPLYPDLAWLFYFYMDITHFYDGQQYYNGKIVTYNAWAVSPGYRATGPATPVPAAGTAGLIVLTLAGLAIYGWRLNRVS